MLLNIFKQEPSITQAKLKDIYPKLSNSEIRRIDWNIKKSIAKDDHPDEILKYIKRELSEKNLNKHKFNQNCYDLKKDYIESNKRWMFQENLFCFYSLIISIIWMCAQLVKLYSPNTWLTSDFAQLGIYAFFTFSFWIVDKIRKTHKLNSFNMFLNLLNRHAPGAIMIGMLICYVALCLVFELWLKAILIFASIIMLISSIIITIIKL